MLLLYISSNIQSLTEKFSGLVALFMQVMYIWFMTNQRFLYINGFCMGYLESSNFTRCFNECMYSNEVAELQRFFNKIPHCISIPLWNLRCIIYMNHSLCLTFIWRTLKNLKAIRTCSWYNNLSPWVWLPYLSMVYLFNRIPAYIRLYCLYWDISYIYIRNSAAVHIHHVQYGKWYDSSLKYDLRGNRGQWMKSNTCTCLWIKRSIGNTIPLAYYARQ